MIHYTPEGHHIKIGLNFSRAPGGFRMLWAWYTPKTHELKIWRLRLRMHIKPRILWSVEKSSVIKSWMRNHDMVPVYRSLLEDEAPRIIALMQLYEEHNYPPQGTEIKITKDQALSIL